ncbi:MAG: GDSL-type esterase/lipase family protein [Solirubrobacteraceae bacterium]
MVALAILVLAACAVQADAATGSPHSLRAPRVTGHAVQTATLRVSRGTWSGGPRTFRHAWLACDASGRRCRARRAAHAATYRLVAADIGHRMRARVTASRRPAGRTLARSALSAPTKRVRAAQTGAPALAALVPGLGPFLAGIGPAGAEPGSPPSAPSAPETPVAPASTPVPMPVISRDAPAYASGGCGDPGAGDDASYDTRWDCPTVPSPAAPAWLAYDLSGNPAARRGVVVVAWFNEPITSQYDRSVTGDPAYNLPRDYAIEVKAAPGGGAPTGGWTRPVAAVTANTYNSRQHRLDLNGANWVRIAVTRADGPAQNDHVTLNMDVHDASAGITDDWIFYGDSITQDGMSHDTRKPASGPAVGTFAELINAAKPAFTPVFQNGGIGGLTSADGAARIGDWLDLFPGRYVTLNYGTNDALVASPGDASIVAPFRAHMKAMAEAVLAAGKVPIIPTIPWGSNPNLRANVPTLNEEIAKLRTEMPEIVAGPDLYTYFHEHQSLIGDGVHPTWEAGYAAMRRVWADFAVSLYP